MGSLWAVKSEVIRGLSIPCSLVMIIGKCKVMQLKYDNL